MFVQIHTLHTYPASCLNRGQDGRPKTAVFGGVERARVSSQSIKSAVRTGRQFQAAFAGSLGTRTRVIGTEIARRLVAGGTDAGRAAEIGEQATRVFNDAKTLAFISPEEIETAMSIARQAAAGVDVEWDPSAILRETTGAVDVALFGRMMTDSNESGDAADGDAEEEDQPKAKKKTKTKNKIKAASRAHASIDAACSVIHPFTTHKAILEDDYISAVDQLTGDGEGAGHINRQYFTSGVFYGYWCVDRDLLVRNLNGNADLANRAVRALIEAVATTAPVGKATTFGTAGTRANAMIVETIDTQPFSLADAFVNPVTHGNAGLLARSHERLAQHREAMHRVYGVSPLRSATLVAIPELDTVGSLSDLTALIGG
jgi:CRISPR system Cascade subunit CasC